MDRSFTRFPDSTRLIQICAGLKSLALFISLFLTAPLSIHDVATNDGLLATYKMLIMLIKWYDDNGRIRLLVFFAFEAKIVFAAYHLIINFTFYTNI